jgi:hypothetical protein
VIAAHYPFVESLAVPIKECRYPEKVMELSGYYGAVKFKCIQFADTRFYAACRTGPILQAGACDLWPVGETRLAN